MVNKYLFSENGFGFRAVTLADEELLAELDCDIKVREFFPDGVISRDKIQERIAKYIADFQKSGYGCYLVFDLNTRDFIGRSGIGQIETGEIEVGYLLLPKFWNKGYATKILSSMLKHGHGQLKLETLIAFTSIHHKASERVMQKAGMKFVGNRKLKGIDCVVYESRT